MSLFTLTGKLKMNFSPWFVSSYVDGINFCVTYLVCYNIVTYLVSNHNQYLITSVLTWDYPTLWLIFIVRVKVVA